MTILISFMWVILVLCMILLMGVILLQEGKGGGLAEAFGGVGGETFGVKAAGIDRFTAVCGALFLLLSVLINVSVGTPEDAYLVEPQPRPEIPGFNPESLNDLIAPPAEGVGDEGGGAAEEDTSAGGDESGSTGGEEGSSGETGGGESGSSEGGESGDGSSSQDG